MSDSRSSDRVETVIIGGGQAGLATSYFLNQAGRSHVVLERAATAAPVWRNDRWDSFTTVTPNLVLRLPGAEYDGPDPDGFLSPAIAQVHSSAYRNPESLPAGAVLVVGSGRSGAQIAEELYRRGRKIFLSTGGSGRAPRRYRGKDIIAWLMQVGFFDLTPDRLPPGMKKFGGVPHVSGTNGGHTLNLHQFARDGVILLGHIRSIADHTMTFAPDIHENLAQADGFEKNATQMIDGFIATNGLDAPPDVLPQLDDGFQQPVIEALDLSEAGITTVIWATGYRFDFSLVKLPVFDADGYPIQHRGVTDVPGLSSWVSRGCPVSSRAASWASRKPASTSRHRFWQPRLARTPHLSRRPERSWPTTMTPARDEPRAGSQPSGIEASRHDR